MGQQSICLDTNFLIRAVIPGTPESGRLRGWVRAERPLLTSSLAWFEFVCGPLTEEKLQLAREGFAIRSIPFDTEQAELAAHLYNATGRRRNLRFDVAIAACAILQGACLATNNRSDFEHFVPFGLVLI